MRGGEMMSEEITCYKCTDCAKVYWTEESAEVCCAPKFCEACGVEVPQYRILCYACADKRRYERAEKITEWDGWVFAEGLGYMDGYFRDIGELIEYCEDDEIDIPEWVFACKPKRHELDIDTALEYMTEDAYEDAYGDLRQVDELREFVREWNKAQDIISYYPDYSRVVILP